MFDCYFSYKPIYCLFFFNIKSIIEKKIGNYYTKCMPSLTHYNLSNITFTYAYIYQ